MWADKGYVCPTIRERPQACGMKDKVEQHGSKSRRVASHEIRRSNLIGYVHDRIEGVFATLKRI